MATKKSIQPTPLEALHSALNLFDGNQTRFANAVNKQLEKMGRSDNISQSTVWAWLNTTERCGPTYAIPIELATENKVSRQLLRPDLY